MSPRGDEEVGADEGPGAVPGLRPEGVGRGENEGREETVVAGTVGITAVGDGPGDGTDTVAGAEVGRARALAGGATAGVTGRLKAVALAPAGEFADGPESANA